MSKYGMILAGICVADLVSTIILIDLGCEKAHPLLSQYFSIGGIAGLATAKVFINGCVILGLEICYHKKPPALAFGKEMKFYYILVINLYVAVYAMSIGSQLIM